LKGYVRNAQVVVIARVIALSRRQLPDDLGQSVRQRIAQVVERPGLAGIGIDCRDGDGDGDGVGGASATGERVHGETDFKIEVDLSGSSRCRQRDPDP